MSDIIASLGLGGRGGARRFIVVNIQNESIDLTKYSAAHE